MGVVLGLVVILAACISGLNTELVVMVNQNGVFAKPLTGDFRF